MYLEVFGDEVDVDVPPEIIIPPKDMTIVKGTPVSSLQCIANAKPLFELELIWLKDGVPIENSGVAFNFNDLWNRTLSLIQADFSHAGIYTCQVRMKTGGPKLTKEAKVEILGRKTTQRWKLLTTTAIKNEEICP